MNPNLSPPQPANQESGKHICCFYESEEQLHTVLRSFLCSGLEAGEKALCLLEPKTAKGVLKHIREAEFDPEPYLECGQLGILTFDETYLVDGAFSPRSMLARLQAETERALQEGYSALRVAGEMIWALKEIPNRRDLVVYESEANLFFEKKPCKAICLYDQREFPPDMLLDVLQAHPTVIIGTEILNNYCYVTPSELLGDNLPEVVLNRRLRSLIERNREEEALRASEKLYRTLLLTSPDAVAATDLNGVITQVSDQALKLHGYQSVDELVGKPAIELFAEEDRERAVENIYRTFEEGYVRGIQYRLLRKDGTRFYGEYNATLIKDADGNPKSIIAAVRDITKRVESEMKLRESEERYRALVEDMPALICRFLPDGTLTFVNEHYSRYYNKGKKELIGQDFFQFIPEEDRERVRAHFASLTPANSVISYEHKVWISDGVARWQRWTDRALFDAQERAVEYQSIGEDITEQKQAEVDLREAYQNLQEAISELKTTQQKVISQERLTAIGQLAAGIAHDFSNTLMPITLYSDLLLRELELSSKQKARLELILQQARRAAGFTQQILDFSRQSLIQFRPLELQALLEKMTDLLRRTLPENIEIQLVCGSEEYRIDGDLGRVEQVLMNLGLNARNAMPDGGQLHLELSRSHFSPEQMPPIPEMPHGDWICISAQDTGDGIPPDQLAHIFEPFYPNGEPSPENGLGLAQVYGIVKQHKGFIDVTSQVGEGTRFDLYIPASEHEGPELIIDSSETAPTGSTQILVVEDDDGTRQALCEILEALQYRVLAACSGVEAVELYKEGEIDLVMSDLVMPEMGGAALYNALRELDPDVKLIVITGYPLEETGRDLVDQGITAWVQKPFDIEKISQTIISALGTKSQ